MIKKVLSIINSSEKKNAVMKLCQSSCAQYIDISSAMLNTPVGQILGVLTDDKVIRKSSASAPALYNPPEILIFYGFNDPDLDRFIDDYNELGIDPILLKGIVTPFNISWTVYELILEYEEESRPNSTL